MLNKDKLVNRSLDIEDLRYVFINFSFATENSIVRGNLYAIQTVGKTSLPNFNKASTMCLRSGGTEFFQLEEAS